MDAAAASSKRPAGNLYRYVPTELVDLILLNLPMKSLIRFSSVSKSWNSMILGPEFAKKYQGREMIVCLPYPSNKALVCPLSSMSTDNPLDNAAAFARPFKADSYFHASCGELWCVEFEESICLYNPSMRTYRKLPTPISGAISGPHGIGSTVDATSISVFVYGLGYDSVGDDYKILKIHRSQYIGTEISWTLLCNSPYRTPDDMYFLSWKGVFFNGALHWLVFLYWINVDKTIISRIVILSFDLSTEKYGRMRMPFPTKNRFISLKHGMDVTVFRGMMCVCTNDRLKFAVWVMKDYGVVKSWTKEFEINYARIHPLCHSHLKLFYFSDSDGNPIKAVTSSTDIRKMFVWKDGDSMLVGRKFGSSGCGIIDSFTYVESFVSP